MQTQMQSCSGWHHTMGQLLIEVSQKYHFTFSFDSALCKWEWIFQKELYSVTPAAFWHTGNFDPQTITGERECTCAQNLNFVSVSIPQIWTGAKSLKWPWPSEHKINSLHQTVEYYYCAKFQVTLIRGLRFMVLTYTPTHTDMHRSWHHNTITAILRHQHRWQTL